MSKLKTNTIENVAGTQTIEISELDNLLTTPYSFRNKVINGDFNIWQRGTSLGAGTWTYIADRWMIGGRESASKYTDSSGKNWIQIKADSNNTNDSCYIGQHIEMWRHLIGKQMVLSFDFEIVTALDNTPRVHFSYGRPVGDTIEFEGTTGRKEIPFTLSEDGIDPSRTSLWFAIVIANNGYSAWKPSGGGEVRISNVQIEEGFATPFEVLPIGQTLALCQRYYENWTGSLLPVPYVAANGTIGNKVSNNISFNTTKRNTPSVTGTLSDGNWNLWDTPTIHGFGLYATQNGNSTCTITSWQADAEL